MGANTCFVQLTSSVAIREYRIGYFTKHILRFLKLIYSKQANEHFIGYSSDADWGIDVETQHSITGYVFPSSFSCNLLKFFFPGRISWISRSFAQNSRCITHLLPEFLSRFLRVVSRISAAVFHGVSAGPPLGFLAVDFPSFSLDSTSSNSFPGIFTEVLAQRVVRNFSWISLISPVVPPEISFRDFQRCFLNYLNILSRDYLSRVCVP